MTPDTFVFSCHRAGSCGGHPGRRAFGEGALRCAWRLRAESCDALRVRRPDRGRSPRARCLLHGGFVPRVAMHFVCIAFVAKATMKVLEKTTKRIAVETAVASRPVRRQLVFPFSDN